MPFEAECHHCNRTFKLKDALLGKKFKCSDCGSIVVAEAILPALPVEPAAKPEKKTTGQRRSSASAARRPAARRGSKPSEPDRPARRSSKPKTRPAKKRQRQQSQEDDLFGGGGGAYDDYDDYSNDFGDVDDKNPYADSYGSSSTQKRSSKNRGRANSGSRKKSQGHSRIGFNVNRLNLALAGIALALGFFGLRESRLAGKAQSEPTSISMSELIANGQPENIYVTVTDVSAEVEEYVYEYRGRDESKYTKVFIPCRARSQDNRKVGMVLLSTSLNSDSEVNPLGRQTEFTGMIVNDIRTIAGEEKQLLNSIPGVNAGNVLIFELGRKPFSGAGLFATFAASAVMLLGSLAWIFLTGTPDAAPVSSRPAKSASKRKNSAFNAPPSRHRTAQSLTLAEMLFQFDGRMSRMQYFVGSLALGITSLIIQVICVFALPEKAAVGGLAILFLVGSFIAFALAAKRAHDMNHPATINILLIVPLINVIWAFMLLFSKGYPGSNQYGDPPG